MSASAPTAGPREGAGSRGPGRPVGPDGKARRIDARIPGALLDRLDAESRARGVTRSRALVQAIRRWLGEAEPS